MNNIYIPDPIKYNISGFLQHVRVIASSLQHSGVFFYGLTMSLPFFLQETQLNKKITLNEELDGIMAYMEILKQYLNDTDMIEIAYVTIQVHDINLNTSKGGQPYFKILLGIRSILQIGRAHV